MPEYTDPYGLSKLGQGESLSADSYKFSRADRDVIARLLYLGAEGHRHTGDAGAAQTLTDPPLVAVSLEGGSLPPGVRLYYRMTLVDPQGFESPASPEARIDTAPAVAAPYQPTNPVVEPTGGQLLPGNYYYVLSAYTDFTNAETEAGNALYVSVPFSTQTNRVSFDLPILPAGATGFNVYRRTPSGSGYLHVAVVNMTEGTPPTQFVDDGTLNEDCDRFAPAVSTARSRNSVIVTFPDDLPVGYSWRIYRTLRANDYVNSLLTTITDGSLTYTDTGTGTLAGQPPVVGVQPGAPTKIDLDNGAEVQGRLPLAAVSAFPDCETFSYPGEVAVLQGTSAWICPFPNATIVHVQAALGRGSTAGADVVVDVNAYDTLNDDWYSIFAVEEDQPRVLAGGQVGAAAAPTARTELVAGDRLTVDIDTDGGGGVIDLTVVIYMLVYGYTEMVSHPWATSP